MKNKIIRFLVACKLYWLAFKIDPDLTATAILEKLMDENWGKEY